MAALEHVEAFNRHLRVLLKGLERVHPGDAEVQRLNKRAGLALDLDPFSLARASGPYLVAYRREIKAAIEAKNDDFFLKRDFADELKKTEDGARPIVQRLIGLVKDSWPRLDEDLKGAYRRAVQKMLDEYLDYLDASDAGPGGAA